MEEIWKDIEELDLDYQISNKGRVKSKARAVRFDYQGGTRVRNIKEKILKPTVKKTGDRIDSHQYHIRGLTVLPSRMVYKYFISSEPVPNCMCVAHKDKNPLNNTVENLVLVTWSESIVMDHKKSDLKKKAQIARSKKGANAMKQKAFFKKLKWWKPPKKHQRSTGR